MVSKKSSPNKSEVTNKKRVIISDSDEEESKQQSKDTSDKKYKKRKINKAFSSDSEDEIVFKTPQQNEKKTGKRLQMVNVQDVFGEGPIKQSQVQTKKRELDIKTEKVSKAKNKKPKPDKNLEITIHDDDDFEKTLLQLDEEQLLENSIKLKDESPKTKKQVDDLNDSGVDPDQDRFEKRRQSAALYQKYLNRAKPMHRGEKEYPKVI